MRILTLIVQLALTAFLVSCDQRHAAPDVDPKLGLECFELHRLPPGTQYEGIEKLAENVLTIRIMNGVEVVTLDCGLNPDGTLQNTGK
ncbi:MAG: hypothetical protein WBP44_15105 [Gammaproteobacteria bacterium]|jgi:hypothetical protein